MRLEYYFIIGSFVYLLVLPLIGSHARGENGASCLASAKSFFTKLYCYSGYFGAAFFLRGPRG